MGVTGTPARGNPPHLTVALKVVNYVGADGKPVLTPEQSRSVVNGINRLYAACDLDFRMGGTWATT